MYSVHCLSSRQEAKDDIMQLLTIMLIRSYISFYYFNSYDDETVLQFVCLNWKLKWKHGILWGCSKVVKYRKSSVVNFSILRIESESGWRSYKSAVCLFGCEQKWGLFEWERDERENFGLCTFPLSHKSHLVIQLLLKT